MIYKSIKLKSWKEKSPIISPQKWLQPGFPLTPDGASPGTKIDQFMLEFHQGPFQVFCYRRSRSALTDTAIRLHYSQYLRLKILFQLPHAQPLRNPGVKLSWNQKSTNSFSNRRQEAPFPLWMACPPPAPCTDRLPSSLPLHAPDLFSLAQPHSSLSCPIRTKSQLWRKRPWPSRSTRVTTLPKPHRSILKSSSTEHLQFSNIAYNSVICYCHALPLSLRQHADPRSLGTSACYIRGYIYPKC